jgi:hypothetical protein
VVRNNDEWSEWRGKVTQGFEGLRESLNKVESQLGNIYDRLNGIDNRLSKQEVKVGLIGAIISLAVTVAINYVKSK